MLQAHSSVLVSRDNAAQLFAHEATRVFHDRLISAEDRSIFYQYLADNLHDYFKVQNSALYHKTIDTKKPAVKLPQVISKKWPLK